MHCSLLLSSGFALALLPAAFLPLAAAPNAAGDVEASVAIPKGILVGGVRSPVTLRFTNRGAERAEIDPALLTGLGLRIGPAGAAAAGAANEPVDPARLGASKPYEIPPGATLSVEIDGAALASTIAGKVDTADVWFEGAGMKSAPATVELVEDLTKARIVLQTSLGKIEVQLDPVHAPLASRNFARHAKSGYYDGTLFHRIIKGFMAQGGDPNSKDADPSNDGGGGKPYNGKPLPSEISDVNHRRGTLSMARNGDPAAQMAQQTVQAILAIEGKNPNDFQALQARYTELSAAGVLRDRKPFLDSAGSQFFLCFGDVAHLDGNYTAFGRMVEGDDVLKELEAVQTGANDRPASPVKIEKAWVKE